MRILAYGLAGLLAVLVLPGLTSKAAAAAWSDGLAANNAAAQYVLVGGRYDRHDGRWHGRGYHHDSWRHHRHHYRHYPRHYTRYYSYAVPYSYYSVPRPYYVVPPPAYYYQPYSYNYYTPGNSLNFGFNLDIHR